MLLNENNKPEEEEEFELGDYVEFADGKTLDKSFDKVEYKNGVYVINSKIKEWDNESQTEKEKDIVVKVVFKDKKVAKITVICGDEEINMSLTYGNASIIIPDWAINGATTEQTA